MGVYYFFRIFWNWNSLNVKLSRNCGTHKKGIRNRKNWNFFLWHRVFLETETPFRNQFQRLSSLEGICQVLAVKPSNLPHWKAGKNASAWLPQRGCIFNCARFTTTHYSLPKDEEGRWCRIRQVHLCVMIMGEGMNLRCKSSPIRSSFFRVSLFSVVIRGTFFYCNSISFLFLLQHVSFMNVFAVLVMYL